MADRYASGSYAGENPDWHESDAPFKALAVASALRRAGLRPRSIVDVGCGTGGVLRALVPLLDVPPERVEGWETAPLPLTRAPRIPGITLVHGDFGATDGFADVVLCLDVFEHVPDDVGFLERLRPRGAAFVFRIPLDLSVLDLARPTRRLEARRRLGHLHAYDRPLALEVLAEAGFELRDEAYDRVPPSTPGRLDRLRRLGQRLAPHAAVRWLGGYSLIVVASGSRSTS